MRLSLLAAIGSLPLISYALSTTTTNTLRALAKRGTVSDILDEIEDATTCTACNALLEVLGVLAETGDSAFVDVITTVCQDLTSEGDVVCAGAIALEGPILAQDLRELSIFTRTSDLLCMTVFGLCQWPDVQPYTVEMSPKPKTSRPAPSGKAPIQIVHISDIHIDQQYETGASYNCSMAICCRSYTAADAPNANQFPAGPYGNIYCDSPISLEESLYAAIDSIVPNRAFTIFTGDVTDHAVWATTDGYVANDLSDTFQRMQTIGRVYGAVGNHDSSPVNSFPPAAMKSEAQANQWSYNNISAAWSGWIGSSAAADVSHNYGSYSVVDPSGVKVISVNTNFWYKENFWMYEPTMESDPSGVLAWLVTELEAAESAGQRAWIIGHMPLGCGDAFHDASNYFDQIVQRFDATIAGMFFGHTHLDHFEISYSDYTKQSANTATMMSYIAPSLTPTSGSPSFRIYSVDPVTFAVLDYSTYYANISSPTYQNGPTWQLLYSAKEAYGPLVTPPLTNPSAELTPAFWHNLTTVFQNNDAAFQGYYARKSRDWSPATCEGDCKTSEICQLRAAQAQYNCATVSPGISFTKRSNDDGLHAHDESACQSSTVVPTLKLVGNGGMPALRDALVKVMGADWLSTVIM